VLRHPSQSGSKEMLYVLSRHLQTGKGECDMHLKDKHSNTPVHLAVHSGSVRVLSFSLVQEEMRTSYKRNRDGRNWELLWRPGCPASKKGL
jgi:hypothetical protein